MNVIIAHCVSADLKMNTGTAADIRDKSGRCSEIFSKLNINVGDATPVMTDNRLIFYRITQKYHYQKPQYDEIYKQQ